MNRGGLCDVCISPGHCCRSLALSGGDHRGHFNDVMPQGKAVLLAIDFKMPFRPTHQDENGVWRWTCPALAPDGRCSIYDDRPHLCRDFSPGSDPLCVHYVPFDDIERNIPNEVEPA